MTKFGNLQPARLASPVNRDLPLESEVHSVARKKLNSPLRRERKFPRWINPNLTET
jgi:hypothetical protein